MPRIMIIRHAEKPHGGVSGVKLNGRRSARSLTPRGWQRAGALVRLFGPVDGGSPRAGIETPSTIYASRVEARERSKRPKFTVRPLADALGLTVDTRFGLEGEQPLATLVSASADPVLVCWHHEGIPRLAALIAPGIDLPDTWPQDRFDIVWVLARDEGTASWSFTQAPQLLLAGDLREPI